ERVSQPGGGRLDLQVQLWGDDCCLEVGPFVFFGDPGLLARVRRAAGEALASRAARASRPRCGGVPGRRPAFPSTTAAARPPPPRGRGGPSPTTTPPPTRRASGLPAGGVVPPIVEPEQAILEKEIPVCPPSLLDPLTPRTPRGPARRQGPSPPRRPSAGSRH